MGHGQDRHQQLFRDMCYYEEHGEIEGDRCESFIRLKDSARDNHSPESGREARDCGKMSQMCMVSIYVCT